jgi:hypothetical protein
MKTQLPISAEEPVAEEEHRVLQFRPRPQANSTYQRGASGDHRSPEPDRQAANDLSRYERDRPPPDDFRHRMLANTAALAFTVALIGIGIWLALSIADLRNTQDCVLMGRRDCARISSQPSPPA